jgi:hypothetical protein
MDLPPLTRDNQWTCRMCGKDHVVAQLARDCEDRDLERRTSPDSATAEKA